MATERQVFRTRRAYETNRELAFPVPGQAVELGSGSSVLASTRTDATGLARFALQPLTHPLPRPAAMRRSGCVAPRLPVQRLKCG